MLGAHFHLEPRNLLPRLPKPRVLGRPSSLTRGGYPRPSPGGGRCSALLARFLEGGQSWGEAAELGRWPIPPTCGCSSGHQRDRDTGDLQRPRRKGSGRVCVGGRGLQVAEISVERDLLGGSRKEECCEPSVCEDCWARDDVPITGSSNLSRPSPSAVHRRVGTPPQTSGLPLSGQEERAPPLHRQKTCSGRLAGTRSLTVALWGHRAGLGGL